MTLPAPPAATSASASLERRRLLRDGLIHKLVGRKVSLSTADFHHVVGWLVEILADGRLRLRVKDRELFVAQGAVARIHTADPALAEYIK